MSKGRLKTCMKLLTGVCVVFLYSALGGTSWAEDEGVAQMKQELRALKAELEALRGEMKSDKDSIKAHDEELLASKQEFSQLSSEVRNWKADPQAVETLKDQIKKELGFVPNVYNEMANKIRLGMELRTRGEFENNWHALTSHLPNAVSGTVSGRGAGTSQDTFEVLNRVRFNIDADVHEHLRAFVQFQDSRFWGFEGKAGDSALQPVGFGTASPNNRIDIHQGYVDIRKLFDPNLVFRVGRQEIKWGTPGPGDPGDRMLGDFGWSNIGNSFDAIRIMWNTERYGAEAFASVLRKDEAPTALSGSAANLAHRNDEDRNLFGARFTMKKLVPQGTVELMYMLDNDDTDFSSVENPSTATGITTKKNRDLAVHDAGFRVVGKVKKAIDYFTETHYQLGDFRGRSHEALATTIGGGYTFDKVAWKPRLGYEFDWSPGDPTPGGHFNSDGTQKRSGNKHRTFHNFYPTNHALYGYADLMSWKNMMGHKFSIKVFPTKKLTAWVDFWSFKLDQGADGWYHAGQGVMPGRAPQLLNGKPTGANQTSTENIGKEFDLTMTYSLYKNVGLMGGYSRLFSGAGVPAGTTTGTNNVQTNLSDADTDWGFLQLTVSF
ncbi:MAG TPA: alginate export family protein [Candidatus Tripitaka californicus]|uniref:alginate export family protein n=1 Tax=Candidatus Tripitaka californicus TaxID=3367616 RepID=UPI004029F1D2|nr:alginate export family protein [Planctomycetota bacterium]